MTGSLTDLLDRIGSRTPAPASGTAAALTGALAAARVELAARFSEDDETLARALELRARLLELAGEDAEAYADFMRTRSGEDRSRTIEVPLAVAAAAEETAALAERLAAQGRGSVRGDALVAAELAHAAGRSASLLAELNRGDGSRL
ncbi:MAG: cyclodeaminase/cyclohydrolase family protein [Gaiellaceae bacterium]